MPEDVKEPESFGIAEDIKKRIVKSGMTVILGPLSIAEPTVEATDGPVSDGVDDAIGKDNMAESTEVLPHFNGERLTAVGDLFQRSTFLVTAEIQGANDMSVDLAYRALMGGETSQEPGHIAQISRNCRGFERAAKKVVASSEVRSVEGELPVAALLGHIDQEQIVSEVQIVTKPVVMDSAGTNRPKFFGSSGST